MDAQTVRCAPQAGPRGVAAGKKTNGRKRHILTDTMGLLLVVLITTGNIQDRDGGKMLMIRIALNSRTYRKAPYALPYHAVRIFCFSFQSVKVSTLTAIRMMYAQRRFVCLRHVWADGGYLGKLVTWMLETLGWTLEIIKRSDKAKGFQVLPRRWVVERSLAWLTRSRRLSRDYEGRCHTFASWCYLANIRSMPRRLDPSVKPL
ncbi:hypothetical protein DESA109040_19750 [Deinococcus saxicola]